MSELRPTERLLLPLVRRFVALWVRPAVLPDAMRERLVSGRPVVYALEKHGVIDLAVLEQTCRDRGLPSPFVAPVTGGVLDASVLFLERRIGVLGLRIDRRMPEALRTLVAQSVADPAFEADIVPVSLFWGRAPGRERSWLRLLFADDWDLGGRFRKFVSLRHQRPQPAGPLRRSARAATGVAGDPRRHAQPAASLAPAAHAVS